MCNFPIPTRLTPPPDLMPAHLPPPRFCFHHFTFSLNLYFPIDSRIGEKSFLLDFELNCGGWGSRILNFSVKTSSGKFYLNPKSAGWVGGVLYFVQSPKNSFFSDLFPYMHREMPNMQFEDQAQEQRGKNGKPSACAFLHPPAASGLPVRNFQ